MEDAKRRAKLWLGGQGALGRRRAAPVIGLGFADIALALAQAWCAALLLAAAMTRGGPVALPAAGFALLAGVRAVLMVLNERAAFAAGAAARRRLRSDALSRLMAAGPAILRGRHSAELAGIVIDRIEALDGFFSRWLPAATLALAGPALVAVTVAIAAPLAAVILIACGLLVPLGMALSGIGAAAASRRQFQALSRLQARFLDRVRGIATIILSGQAAAEARTLEHAADELRRRTMRVLRLAFLSSATLDCAQAAALVILAIHYGLLLAASHFHHPAVALFLLLTLPEFFAPLRAFSLAYQDRMHAFAAAEELSELPPAPAAPVPAGDVRTVTASGVSVAFEEVQLTWEAARGPALDRLSFRVPAGETLVLVGPSGAGKSSVLEILLGFARPDSGRVTVNGADIGTLVPAALSRLIAWIGQRPMIFAGTIRDNIRFARPEASTEEIEQATRLARVDAFAATLPKGLDTVVGEGGYGLSGGQAQRIAIARAFLKNAPLLLLDEPTAHLDPATEAEILDSLRRLAAGRTVMMASHSVQAHALPGRRLDLQAGRAVAVQGAA